MLSWISMWYTSSAAFFNGYNYNHTCTALLKLMQCIHNNFVYPSTGRLQLVNETEHRHPNSSLITEFYPTAYSRIRNTESRLNVTENRELTIQFVGKA
ncbi:hypothetical protein CC78DRAFT_577082 [Lojkania enalia]|uniref:Uncharacterized protein n=1 Tax=Lojkania enalia TaxID=147567 RepID=A0A9P4N8Z5_9PLEO|nr:hypothetical protein CC78DRAFT_577082 [Didymosphaeria enalia]